MNKTRIRKTIAILLAVLFLVTVTAGAVSAANYMYEKANKPNIYSAESASAIVKGAKGSAEVYKYLNIWVGNGGYATQKNVVQSSDDTSKTTITATKTLVVKNGGTT